MAGETYHAEFQYMRNAPRIFRAGETGFEQNVWKKNYSVCNHDFVQFFSHIIPRDISLTMLNFSSSRFATQKSQKHIIQADS